MPNSNQVYISYLDSIRFFDSSPSKIMVAGVEETCRTLVYHSVLCAYMAFVKEIGYTHVNIWVEPPQLGDDYIFNVHTDDHFKNPMSALKLKEWYTSMLKKACAKGITLLYRPMADEYSYINTVREIPTADSDLMSTIMTDVCKEQQQQQEIMNQVQLQNRCTVDIIREVQNEMRRIDNVAYLIATLHISADRQCRMALKKQQLRQEQLLQTSTSSHGQLSSNEDSSANPDVSMSMMSPSLNSNGYDGNSLVGERLVVYQPREKIWLSCVVGKYLPHKRKHLVVYDVGGNKTELMLKNERYKVLKPIVASKAAEAAPLEPPTVKPLREDCEPYISNKIVDHRTTFLEFCQNKNWQFNKLRHAQHSTLMLLYHLHKCTTLTPSHEVDIPL